MKRARSREQKEQRRQAILKAAWGLFQKKAFDALKMSDVAAAAGLTKAAVYLYFDTKEELFLSVMEVRLAKWVAEVNRWMYEHAGAATPESVAAFITGSLGRQKHLARMMALIYPVLERNVDFDVAVRFKETVGAHVLETGRLLEVALPGLPFGFGAKACIWLEALVTGIYPMSHPTTVGRRVLRRSGLQMLQMDFDQTLEAILTAVLRSPFVQEAV